ncbi:MAG: helix-turn-helix transcriptional regulator [Candidatus Saccharicenans sp.]|nr:helix-turn-helix transcriptional regulator [Candidatus Saccharicenans sp.]
MKTFGEHVRELRLRNHLTLRRFCELTRLDPSNWSKIERGLMPPPKSSALLMEISKILNLKEGSEDYNTLFDLAAIGHIPANLLSTPRVMEKLPVFFRTIRGDKPARKELEELINILSEE